MDRMLSFVAAARRRDRPHTTPARFLEGRHIDVHFEPSNELAWSDDRDGFALRAWERPVEEWAVDTHWCVRPDGVTLFDGYVHPTTTTWDAAEPVADQLADLVHVGPTELGRTLGGLFSLVHASRDGRAFFVSDPLGLNQLYRADTDDLVIIGSHAAGVASAAFGPRPRRDPLAGAWLAYAGHILGDRTGFEGVRTVPAGHCIGYDPAVGLAQEAVAPPPWGAELRTASPGELVEIARSAIRRHMDAIMAMPGAKRVALTGGRDSRLNLAMLLESGHAADATFFTLGEENLRDVIIARRLADRWGLDHEWGRRRSRLDVPYAERARAFVAASGGVVNLWDESSRIPEPAVNVSGLLGEVISTGFPGTDDVRSPRALRHRFARDWGFGDQGLLRREIFDQLRVEAERCLFDPDFADASPIELIDLFFARQRLRRRTGSLEEVDRSHRVFPLYSLATLEVAFAIGDQRRRAEYLHYHIMRGVSPELTEIPFADDGWKRAMLDGGWPPAAPDRFSRGRAALGKLRHRAGGLRSSAPETAKQADHRRAANRRAPLIREVLLGDPTHPVYEVLDPDRTRAAVARLDELGVEPRKRLFGAATAAIWLGQVDASTTGPVHS